MVPMLAARPTPSTALLDIRFSPVVFEMDIESGDAYVPRVHAHKPDAPPIRMQCLGRNTDDSKAQARMHERLVEILPLKGRHAAIFASLAVEEQVGQDCASYDGPAIEELSGEGAGVGPGVCGGLGQVALEGVTTFDERGDRGGRFRGVERGFGRRVESAGWGEGGFGELFEGCGEGEGTPQYEGHG